MKKLHVLSTVAAAVLLTAGVCAAQTSGKEETHKAPQATSDQSKSTNHEKSEKSQAAQEKSRAAESANEKEGRTGAQEKRGESGQRESKESATSKDKSKAARDDKNEATTEKQSGAADRMRGQHDQTAGEKDKSGSSARSNRNEPSDQAKERESGKASSYKTSTQSDKMNSSTRQETTGKNEGTEGHNAATNQTHTGATTQGMSGAHLTAEQRTKIRETVINRNNAPRVDRVDFAMNVGTVVPDSVRIVEVPPTLVDIDPTWRGDEYFVVRDEIVVVDQGRRIVATLPLGSESASEETSTTSTGGGTAATTTDLSSDEIREVQTVLVEKGFLKGRADGMFGPETREALIAFQKHEGIETTGRIDTRTVGSLGLQDKIKAGGTRGELGTGSSSGMGQGARNSGQREGMKDREPDTAGESNRGATTTSPSRAGRGAIPTPARRVKARAVRAQTQRTLSRARAA